MCCKVSDCIRLSLLKWSVYILKDMLSKYAKVYSYKKKEYINNNHNNKNNNTPADTQKQINMYKIV